MQKLHRCLYSSFIQSKRNHRHGFGHRAQSSFYDTTHGRLPQKNYRGHSMKIITSIHNEEVKLVAALKNGKDRDDQGRFIAEGSRVIATFVQAGWKPTMLYATE